MPHGPLTLTQPPNLPETFELTAKTAYFIIFSNLRF
jgi:hypothetical protein